MIHKMKLNNDPFEDMKNGNKKIEIRLNDEKRQKLATGDTVEFSKTPELNEKLSVEVKDLLPFKSFDELYDKLRNGVDSEYLKKWDKDGFVSVCREFYTMEQEKVHGALAIRVEVL